MRTIVLYKTMTGCTQRYAEIISQKLEADLLPLKRARAGKLAEYDTIVFGGCVHGGSISGLRKFKKLANRNGNAKAIVFAVGASPDNEKTVSDLTGKNFLEEPNRANAIKFFYMQGGFDLERMKQPFRSLMKWVKGMVEMNPEKKPDEVEFLKMFDVGDGAVGEKNAEELVRYLKGL